MNLNGTWKFHLAPNPASAPDDFFRMHSREDVLLTELGLGTVFGAGPDTVHQAVEQMRARGHDVPLDKEKADYLVLTSVVDMMLFTDQLEATIKIFNSLGLDWTFRSDGFEGANFGLLAGVADVQKQASMKVIETAIAIGAKAVVVPECGHAYPALRWNPMVSGGKLPFEMMYMSEYMGKQAKAGRQAAGLQFRQALLGNRLPVLARGTCAGEAGVGHVALKPFMQAMVHAAKRNYQFFI